MFLEMYRKYMSNGARDRQQTSTTMPLRDISQATVRVGEMLMSTSPSTMSNIEKTLEERGGLYGSFDTHAEYAEAFNQVYEASPNWCEMRADSKEALRIIANKIGRILNGDPEYDDNWHDIAGYATLVEQRINRGA
jgi:hypothetical protein